MGTCNLPGKLLETFFHRVLVLGLLSLLLKTYASLSFFIHIPVFLLVMKLARVVIMRLITSSPSSSLNDRLSLTRKPQALIMLSAWVRSNRSPDNTLRRTCGRPSSTRAPWGRKDNPNTQSYDDLHTLSKLNKCD